jgi:hypothetical protein
VSLFAEFLGHATQHAVQAVGASRFGARLLGHRFEALEEANDALMPVKFGMKRARAHEMVHQAQQAGTAPQPDQTENTDPPDRTGVPDVDQQGGPAGDPELDPDQVGPFRTLGDIIAGWWNDL